MLPSLALQTHREAIRAIALIHRVARVRMFGSVLTSDDTDACDLDILVEPTKQTTLMANDQNTGRMASFGYTVRDAQGNTNTATAYGNVAALDDEAAVNVNAFKTIASNDEWISATARFAT